MAIYHLRRRQLGLLDLGQTLQHHYLVSCHRHLSVYSVLVTNTAQTTV